jgi:hypothetical protein
MLDFVVSDITSSERMLFSKSKERFSVAASIKTEKANTNKFKQNRDPDDLISTGHDFRPQVDNTTN